MATRIADGRNPDKTKLQAQTSKEKVAIAKVNELNEWRKKLAAKERKIDRAFEDMKKGARKIGDMMKRREETTKAVEDFGDMLQGTLKELQTLTHAPGADALPKPPTNMIGMATMLPFMLLAAAWWAKTKAKLK